MRADLGASRFGPVYLGRDPSTNTRVVIRTFELSRAWREFGEVSDLLESFRKLCETTLDHQSLARPLAFGAEEDIPYLVYSDPAGTAMDVVMRRDGPRPVAEVLQRARQLADAIDFAASAGVHHGMMAPCDVILDDERTGVTGFGLAQALIEVGIPAEAGSPYGSPKRLAGASPTISDDIYSLAAITLELLIGTPEDPNQDMHPALREAQGLPDRIQRPAPHETRVFTSIAGVDAGKLRASFAAALSEEPGGRPSTASAFVASFQDAISSKRGTDEPAPSVVAVPSVSDERKDPPSAPVLAITRSEDGATLELPSRQERVAAERVVVERPATPATSEPLIRKSHKRRKRKRENRSARPEPIVVRTSVADVTPPRASAADEASHGIPDQWGSRALLVAMVVGVSFGAGFGGGFIVGRRSTPPAASIEASDHESVAEPQPTRAPVEDPKPIASTTQPVAPIAEEKVSSHNTRQQRLTSSERRPTRSVDLELRRTSVPAHATAATDTTGSLQVASRPSGAQVFVDDSLIGTTPLLLSNVAAGSRRLRLELSGYRIWMRSVRIEPSARFRVSASLQP